MELNREQIIKALECCTRGRKSKEDRPCLDCPYNECNLVGGTSERQTAGTCQRYDECSPYVTPDETFPEVGGCGRYAKAPTLELVSRAIKDYCYSLIDAGKDSVEVTEFNADFQYFLEELYKNGTI